MFCFLFQGWKKFVSGILGLGKFFAGTHVCDWFIYQQEKVYVRIEIASSLVL